jgi:hypothetical protein
MTAAREPLVVEWGSAGAALDGADSGDACVVAPFPGGALVAVIDGLGHGPEARDATREAVRILEACAGEPLGALVERCHEALRKTRGAVMSLASFDARAASLTWLGVGNVEGFLLRAAPGGRPRESLTLRGGVVGYQLPPLRPAALSVARGDTLVMATDGIRSAFVADLAPSPRPQELADAILARHARGTDDALVLVARYAGGER